MNSLAEKNPKLRPSRDSAAAAEGDHATAARDPLDPAAAARSVRIAIDGFSLAGELTIAAGATGVVLFAHGSGSGRYSPRNRLVARTVQASGTATLLFDLLSPAEERADADDGHLRFNIDLLALRLVHVVRWIDLQPETRHLGIGFLGASTGGAAALVAAAKLGPVVQAVVSRGGRPDLAGEVLARVRSPTLLIVGRCDEFVLQLNREACDALPCAKQLIVVPRATHLFEEPGALDLVAALAAGWFRQYLAPR